MTNEAPTQCSRRARPWRRAPLTASLLAVLVVVTVAAPAGAFVPADQYNGNWVATPGATAAYPPVASPRARCNQTSAGWRVRILKSSPNWTRTSQWYTNRNTTGVAQTFKVTQERDVTVSLQLGASVEGGIKAPLLGEAKAKLDARVTGSVTSKRGYSLIIKAPPRTNTKAAIGVERKRVLAKAYYLNTCGQITKTQSDFVSYIPWGTGARYGTF